MENITYAKIAALPSAVAIVNKSGKPVLTDAQSALDLIASARYNTGCDAIIIDKKDIAEDFFDLKSRIAGEVLQKFTNYNMRLAIVGDFGGYTSKSLRDFIRESNRGDAVFFVATHAEATQRLAGC